MSSPSSSSYKIILFNDNSFLCRLWERRGLGSRVEGDPEFKKFFL